MTLGLRLEVGRISIKNPVQTPSFSRPDEVRMGPGNVGSCQLPGVGCPWGKGRAERQMLEAAWAEKWRQGKKTVSPMVVPPV
jgi:hypothetical protein